MKNIFNFFISNNIHQLINYIIDVNLIDQLYGMVFLRFDHNYSHHIHMLIIIQLSSWHFLKQAICNAVIPFFAFLSKRDAQYLPPLVFNNNECFFELCCNFCWGYSQL
jgi:hypothetical protein